MAHCVMRERKHCVRRYECCYCFVLHVIELCCELICAANAMFVWVRIHKWCRNAQEYMQWSCAHYQQEDTLVQHFRALICKLQSMIQLVAIVVTWHGSVELRGIDDSQSVALSGESLTWQTYMSDVWLDIACLWYLAILLWPHYVQWWNQDSVCWEVIFAVYTAFHGVRHLTLCVCVL